MDTPLGRQPAWGRYAQEVSTSERAICRSNSPAVNIGLLLSPGLRDRMKLILASEGTGNLDTANGKEVMQLLTDSLRRARPS